MDFIDRLVTYPSLWVVYMMLSLLSGPCSSFPVAPTFLDVTDVFSVLQGNYTLGIISFPLTVYLYMKIQTVFRITDSSWKFFLFGMLARLTHHYAMYCTRPIQVILILVGALYFKAPIAFIVVVVISVKAMCILIYFSKLLIFIVVKGLTHLLIVGLKNRRACQFLSALSSLLIGLTKDSKVFASIPISIGMLLSIPDFDPDPELKFKIKLSEFLVRNMDEQSLTTLLHSKFHKMLCCNEMMPCLEVENSDLFARFLELKKQGASQDQYYCDSNDVRLEYKIGLGSLRTKFIGENLIEVIVVTPYSGVKIFTMSNTPLSRYNLDESARFWEEYPKLGISKADKTEGSCHPTMPQSISIEEWIKFCGSEDFVFVKSREV